MRQDKTIAQILLVFSVNNVALAASAIIQHRHPDELEKRDSEGSDDEASDGLVFEPMARVSIRLRRVLKSLDDLPPELTPGSSHHDPMSGSPAGSSDDDWA